MTSNNPKSNEELDLLYFFKPVGDLFKSIGRGVAAYIRILTAKRWIFLSIFVFFAAAIYLLKFTIPRAYKSEGIFLSRVIPGEYCSMLIQNLNSLISSGANAKIVAEKMNIQESMIGDIKSLSLSPISDTFAISRPDSLKSLFKLDVVLNSNNSIDSIQKGLIYFLENSDFAKKRKEARIASINALQKNFGEKIISLDTVKKIVNNSLIPRSQGNGIVFGEPVNPVDIYDAETIYYKEILKLREELAIVDNIQVIQPLLRRNDLNYPDYNFINLFGFLFALALAMIITPMTATRTRR